MTAVKRWWIVLSLMLSACAAAAPPPTASPPALRWERSPSSVVFRAETINAQADEFTQRGVIPTCSVYGDNRVVYVIDTSEGSSRIGWDVLSDAVIADFAAWLITETPLAALTSGIDALPAGVSASQVEQVYLAVNERLYRADSLGGWPTDFFARVVTRCEGLSTSPAEFIPDAAYVAVREIEYQSFLPDVVWESEQFDLEAQISVERTWITGDIAGLLWQTLRERGDAIQFRQGERTFQVVLEVPGVTRGSPPAP